MTICCPWDDGAITGMFSGSALEQKTVKTRCGKRRPVHRTSVDRPTCPWCLADIERQKIGLKMLEQYAADTLQYGQDEANRRAQAFAEEHGL